MRVRLRSALTEAMKSRDRAAVSALRGALSAIENAEAVDAVSPSPSTTGTAEFAGAVRGLRATEARRRDLTEDELAAIVRREITERRAAAEDYDRLGRHDHATRLRHEADALERASS